MGKGVHGKGDWGKEYTEMGVRNVKKVGYRERNERENVRKRGI